jgi:predicted MFS family arabinose efflux permease
VRPLSCAFALALAAAVALGMSRFSRALTPPPMRSDFDWNCFTTGTISVVNAAGYLVGALLMPRALGLFDARALLLAGGTSTSVLLALHAAARGDAALYLLRLASGPAGAASFVAGGLLPHAWPARCPPAACRLAWCSACTTPGSGRASSLRR